MIPEYLFGSHQGSKFIHICLKLIHICQTQNVFIIKNTDSVLDGYILRIWGSFTVSFNNASTELG